MEWILLVVILSALVMSIGIGWLGRLILDATLLSPARQPVRKSPAFLDMVDPELRHMVDPLWERSELCNHPND